MFALIVMAVVKRKISHIVYINYNNTIATVPILVMTIIITITNITILATTIILTIIPTTIITAIIV